MKIVIGIGIWTIASFILAVLFGCMARYGGGEKFDFWTWWKKR